MEVENVLEGQQPIRAASAEAGQQRRLGGALRRPRGDYAVGCEMKDAILIEVGSGRQPAVGELIAGEDFDAVRIELADDRARRLELLGGDRVGPRRQGQNAIAVSRGRHNPGSRSRWWRILAEPEIGLPTRGGRRIAQLCERARADRRANVAIAAEPGDPAEVIGRLVAGLCALLVGVDR